jgi:hypothetical protein
MKTPRIIGNSKSREFHIETCPFGKAIHEENLIEFVSIQQALDHNFDPCGHCLHDLLVKDEERSVVSAGAITKRYYFAHLERVFGGVSTNDNSGIEVKPGDTLSISAHLHECNFNGKEWNFAPVADHAINLSCDAVAFPSKTTNSDGMCAWTATVPESIEPGETSIRGVFNISEHLIFGHSSTLHFTVPVEISNIRISPNPFQQKTKIYFKLATDKKIKAEIFRNTYFANPHSHVNTIRSFADGAIKANDDVCLEWDGTIDHGFRKGLPVMRGEYVLRITGEKGESDMEFKEGLVKQGGIGMMGEPEPPVEEPTDYVDDLIFDPNPLSKSTKTTLSFTLTKDAVVSIHIEHARWRFRGNCTREIIDGTFLKKGNHSFVWDGKNNRGNRTSLGQYKVRVLANGQPYVKSGLHKKLRVR